VVGPIVTLWTRIQDIVGESNGRRAVTSRATKVALSSTQLVL
jgi:hypothetical protein